MNTVYLWCVSTVTVLVAVNTIWRLFTERERLAKEDLNDDDRVFAWRIVIFLIFPLLNWLDLRATTTVCELLGGYLRNWTYGFLWYQAVPAGLPSPEMIVAVLFSGSLVTTLFALCLIPSLAFRPHPFIATLIGYTVAFVLALNLVADPLLSLIGLGGVRWQLALKYAPPNQLMPLIAVHASLALVYLLIMRSSSLRLWFSSLTRPESTAELSQALASLHSSSTLSAQHLCSIAILYDRAALHRNANKIMRKLKEQFPYSPYAYFLEAVVAYRKRDYKKARKAFIYTSDYLGIDGELKASLLAAAACAAFADNDLIGALNLCERALEFDDKCVISRMVKVDVFLRQNKKEHAADEILVAMHMGLPLELSGKTPLDVKRAFELLADLDQAKSIRPVLQPK